MGVVAPGEREKKKEVEEKTILSILWRCYARIFFTIKANPVFTDVRMHL